MIPDQMGGNFLRLAHVNGCSGPPYCANQSTIAFDTTKLQAANTIVAKFRFRITVNVNGRADGLGFALLRTSSYGMMGGVPPECPYYDAEEARFKESLGIGFDIYRSEDNCKPNGQMCMANWKCCSQQCMIGGAGGAAGAGTGGAAGAGMGGAAGAGGMNGVCQGQGPVCPPNSACQLNGGMCTSNAECCSQDCDAGFCKGLCELNNDHVSVRFDQRLVGNFDAGLDLASGQWIDAEILLWPGGSMPEVTVKLKQGSACVLVVNKLEVPGLTPYEGRVWFGARAGGETADIDIDQVNVQYDPPTIPILACPTDNPTDKGKWDPILPWRNVGIHAHLLRNGRVLSWDRHDYPTCGNDAPVLWDPAANPTQAFAETLMPDVDIFCSGHSFLPDGRLFVTGGHRCDNSGEPTVRIYDAMTDMWTDAASSPPDMNDGRWYPTNVTLANGDVLVVSGYKTYQKDGMAVCPIPQGMGGTVNDLPQVWETATKQWRNLTGAMAPIPVYPRMHLAPDGSVFYAGENVKIGGVGADTWYLDTVGQGTWTQGPQRNPNNPAWTYGSSVIFDDRQNVKVLLVGGGGDPGPPTSSAEIITLEPNPSWKATGSMNFPRRQHTATMLPDGKVLVTGGTSAPGFNDGSGAVLPAEIWDPEYGYWTEVASMKVPRLYHSTALLLPDGRVLSLGGGHPGEDGANKPDAHPSAEIYSPPYLFKGPRPTISLAPQQAYHSSPFFVETPDPQAIDRVTMIRLGSVTHGFNQDQRFNQLESMVYLGDPCRKGLVVTLPNANRAPPGPYMLFLLDKSGVPSVGHIFSVAAPTDCTDPNNAGKTCDDGMGCTEGETCMAGACTGGTSKSCPAPDECHLPGSCDPITGICCSLAAPDGTPCTGGMCLGGVCTPAGTGGSGGQGAGGGGTGGAAGAASSSSTGGAASSSTTSGAGTAGGGGEPNCEDGCCCRMLGSAPAGGPGWLLLLLGLPIVRRRR